MLPLLVFAIGTALTLGLVQHLQHRADQERQASIASDSALVTSEIRERLRAHAQFLRGIRALVSAHPNLTPNEWQDFSRHLQVEKGMAGIQAYGFAPLVPRGQQDAFVAAMRRLPTHGTFDIHPRATEAATALPIIYLAPETPVSTQAIGYNLSSESRRADAVEQARDRDDIVLSGRTELVTEEFTESRQPGLLMVLPVYRSGMPLGSVDERRLAFIGVVYAAYRIHDFMQSLNFATSNTLGLRIFDDESFNRDSGTPALTLLFESSPFSNYSNTAIVDERELEFGQRNWHLQLTSSRPPALRQDIGALMVGGILISMLLALISRAQNTYRRHAEALARDMTQELRVSQERFQLAVDGTEDGIFDRDLVTGHIWRSERLKAILGEQNDTAFADLDAFGGRIHPEDRDSALAALTEHFEQRTPYRSEYRFRKGDGAWAWLESRGRAVWDAEGKPVRLVGSITDVTARHVAEARAEHYRSFLATVLKFIPHPVFVKNGAREYIAVNAAFCNFVDQDESTILGSTVIGTEAMAEEVTAHIRAMDDRVFAGEGEQVEENLLPLARGSRIIVTRKTLARDPDGNPILIGTLTDVTELRLAERERGEVARQRKAILDAATEVAIISTDINGTIKMFNRGAERMLGYRAEDLVDRASPACFHLPDEVEERANALRTELGRDISGFEVFVVGARTHGSERREWTYLRKDGSRLRVSLGVTAVHDAAGEIAGYLGMAVDVTARENALAELQKQTARMQTIIEHIPGGVSLIDRELNFIAANDELKRILDFPDSLFAAGSPSLYDVALFNARRGEYGPGDPEEIAAAVVERARHPTPHCFERTRPDGRTLEVRGTPLPDGGFVTIYTDITERKLAEAELLRHRDRLQELVDEQTASLLLAKNAAERASAAKSEFLANMSHELRTPMHSVLNFARLGQEKANNATPDRLEHYFSRIHQSGTRLLDLLNDLLDLSKFEAGMMRVNLQERDVLPVIKEAVGEMETWALSHSLTLTIEQKTLDTSAAIDALRLGQVIRNLLSNAIKFSREGGRIHVVLSDCMVARGRRASDTGDVAGLQIAVEDEGCGIPEAELEHIFDKFVQSSSTKTGAGGTGLGLAICREITLAHRGSIRACNNLQKGASLILAIPRNAPPVT